MPNVYKDYYDLLKHDHVLKRRLVGAIAYFRNVIRAEAGDVTHHAKRLLWAAEVDSFSEIEAMANRMLLDVLADPVLAVNPEQVGDADPDGRLAYILNNASPAGLLFTEAKLDAYVA